MQDRLRGTGFAQWALILMPVVPVLSLLPQYQALWVVLVAYFLGTYPIWATVVRRAKKAFWIWQPSPSAAESVTVLGRPF